MNSFYVIIERNGSFVPYDILPYLSDEWGELGRSDKKKALLDLQGWVDGRLRYRFWARCEYEVILSPWPPSPRDNSQKVDIYWQALPNLKTITRLFSENEGITI